jgi:pilus assembly protein Flp/PilA
VVDRLPIIAKDANRLSLLLDRKSRQKSGIPVKEKEKRMTAVSHLLGALHQDETGQDLVEYALVAALIAFAAVAAMNTLANNVENAFSKVGSKLASAIS